MTKNRIVLCACVLVGMASLALAWNKIQTSNLASTVQKHEKMEVFTSESGPAAEALEGEEALEAPVALREANPKVLGAWTVAQLSCGNPKGKSNVRSPQAFTFGQDFATFEVMSRSGSRMSFHFSAFFLENRHMKLQPEGHASVRRKSG